MRHFELRASSRGLLFGDILQGTFREKFSTQESATAAQIVIGFRYDDIITSVLKQYETSSKVTSYVEERMIGTNLNENMFYFISKSKKRNILIQERSTLIFHGNLHLGFDEKLLIYTQVNTQHISKYFYVVINFLISKYIII